MMEIQHCKHNGAEAVNASSGAHTARVWHLNSNTQYSNYLDYHIEKS